MNITGKVDKTSKEKYIDTEQEVLVSTIKNLKNNLEKTRLMFGVGVELRPAKNDRMIIIPFGNSERNRVAVGGVNEQITPIVEDGERRFYSTNANGDIVQVNIYMKNDGSLLIETRDIIEIDADSDIYVDTNETLNLHSQKNCNIDSDTFIVLQSGSDFAVRYSAINTLFTQIQTLFNSYITNFYNIHTHVTIGYTSDPPTPLGSTVTIDASPAKIDNIKVP